MKSLEWKGRTCLPYIFTFFVEKEDGGRDVLALSMSNLCEWDSCCPALFEMFQDDVEQAHLNGTQLLFLFCFLKVLWNFYIMHNSFFMQNKSMQPTRDKEKNQKVLGGIRFWIVSTITMFFEVLPVFVLTPSHSVSPPFNLYTVLWNNTHLCGQKEKKNVLLALRFLGLPK